jgi:REP element-mobilizing transposase RayT
VGHRGVPPIDSPQFHPFQESADLEITKRNLPHWRQPGATYFVTFRLVDAVPASVLRDWAAEKDNWLKFHPEPWDSATKFEYRQKFTEAREEWLDAGSGDCILREPEIAKIVADSLSHFDGERYQLDDFVVMPNHVHVLVQPKDGHDLTDIVGAWKSFTAKAINKQLGKTGSVWFDESYDRIVRDFNELVDVRGYIARNPMTAKLREGEFVLRSVGVLQDTFGGTPLGPTAGTAVPRSSATPLSRRADHPILVDHFLEDATEVDVDCISDGETVVIGAIMEHIEQAGIHSGDSACVIPPFSLSEKVKAEIADATKKMARELNVIGLMNVQFAVQNETVYVLEVNPRASRTAPFVSKAIGVPLPKLAAKIMAGAKLKDLGFTKEVVPAHYCVKEAVFPFTKFPGTDIVLGPEMKSTGEVMGIDANFGIAYAKAQMAAQPALPQKGNVFISVADADKTRVAEIARGFADLGFTLYATSGTAAELEKAGVPVKKLFKLSEGRPNALDMLKNGELCLVINTPSGKAAREDEVKIRSTASSSRVPVMTTVRAARASLEGIRAMRSGYTVKPLQEWHR